MISVVIASLNEDLLTKVKSNISDTIGVVHEIIVTKNTAINNNGICQIYNNAAALAKYDILCYMHEDIEMKTSNWGKKIVSYFDEIKDLGIIGIFGSTYKTFVPSGWGVMNDSNSTNFGCYIQGFKSLAKRKEYIQVNRRKESFKQVLCIDGMWFCTTKKIVSENPFDDETFKHFHGYDIDFCLSLYNKYNVIVTYEVLLEHFSEGTYNAHWFEEAHKLHEKWKKYLPMSSEVIPSVEKQLIDKRSFKWLIQSSKKLSLTKGQLLQLLYFYWKSGKFSLKSYIKLAYYSLKF